ncbi:MAG TPA: DUF3788 family protein [Lacunisphaera sp.]|nr:DUF3788 family protein [Lacunisphaera sp.]
MKNKMVTVPPPRSQTLTLALGRSRIAWDAVIAAMHEQHAPLDVVWQPSAQLSFGSYCRLLRRKRTLLYLLPKGRRFEVVVGLGQRAAVLALKADLPPAIHRLIATAKVYPEGRFVRFDVTARTSVPAILRLVALKVAPK